MDIVKFELLPKELIAHIACCSDVSSVLRLGQTCKTIRSACSDSLVFKDLLVASQRHRWASESLDIDAVSQQANNGTATWARYALADDMAWELSRKECPLETPQGFITYLPELFIVRHPFMNALCWKRFLRKPLEQISNQVFCLAMAILASDDEMPQVSRSLRMQDIPYLQRDETMKAFLWSLCTMALTLRSSLKRRRDVWPYNHAANKPHITPPKASQLPLQPLNDHYGLPTPFSRRPVELLGRSTSSFSNWDSWYYQHTSAAFHSPSFLTEGTWCGYYIHFGVEEGLVDPPMTDIRFQCFDHPRQAEHTFDETEAMNLHATNCVDGIDRFDVHGTICDRNRTIEFNARKQYRNGTGWDWDLRLSPFGLIGYWGVKNVHENRLSRYGIVWLWKNEWMQASR